MVRRRAAHAAAAAQRLPDVVAQRPDIRALGAPHPQNASRREPSCSSSSSSWMVTRRGGRSTSLPLPGQLIELLPADLDGGVHGRHLVDLPGEPRQHVLQLPPASRQHRARPSSTSPVVSWVLVVSPSRSPATYSLSPPSAKRHRPGGLSHEHRQHAGGHGVQRSGVAHLFRFQYAPQLAAHRCCSGNKPEFTVNILDGYHLLTQLRIAKVNPFPPIDETST